MFYERLDSQAAREGRLERNYAVDTNPRRRIRVKGVGFLCIKNEETPASSLSGILLASKFRS